MIATEEYLKTQNKGLAGTSFVIQGFGNVGTHAARILHEAGAKVVAIGDHTKSFYDEAGLDIPGAIEHVKAHRTLEKFAGPEIPRDDILGQPCDVLIPAALGDVITEDVAKELTTTLIVEAANGPTTPEGDKVLIERKIPVLPDIFANAGGVTVSYFEWAQNIQQFAWEYDRVKSELERIMRAAFVGLAECANKHNLDFRTAAFVVAIERVKYASDLRGY